jgi:predicted nucleic-acid-binding protein
MEFGGTSRDAVRAVDTNVLVRLITRDDLKQVAAAEAYVASGAWVSHLALAEATWVLTSVYDRSPEAIATAVEMLLNHQHLTLQDAAAVFAAVQQFRRHPAVGFSDCLMVEVARAAGHGPLGTFDRHLGKVDGAHRL